MRHLVLWLTTFAVICVSLPAGAQEAAVDPMAVEEIAGALSKFEAGAWLLGVAVIARVLSSITKGFSPLWNKLKDKPHLKWVHPSVLALLTALATAPLLTTNPVVVIIVSVVAAALSGFAAVGWYHGPTWIGGDPLKHAKAKEE